MKSQEIAFVTTLILQTRENKAIWIPGPTPDVIVTEDSGKLVSFQPEPRYLSVIYRGKDKHERFYVNKALCDQLISWINYQSKTPINKEETRDELMDAAINEMINSLSVPTTPTEFVPVQIPVATKVQPVIVPELPKVETIVVPEVTAVENKNHQFFTLNDMLSVDRSIIPIPTKGYTEKTFTYPLSEEELACRHAVLDTIIEEMLGEGMLEELTQIGFMTSFKTSWKPLRKKESETIYGFRGVMNFDGPEPDTQLFLFKDTKGKLFCRMYIVRNDFKQVTKSFSDERLYTIFKLITRTLNIESLDRLKLDNDAGKQAEIPFLDTLISAIEESGLAVTTEKLPVNTAEMNKRLEVKYSDGRFLEFTYEDKTELRCYLCTGGKNKRIFINRFKDVSAIMGVITSMRM